MKTVKNPIKINFEKKLIVISRAFANRASVVGSREYITLSNTIKDFPAFEVVIRKIAQSNSEHHRGLTYEYMEYYISTHADAEKRLEEFKEIKLRSECHSMKYGNVKKWFLSTYPNINDFTPEDYAKEKKPNFNELLDVA